MQLFWEEILVMVIVFSFPKLGEIKLQSRLSHNVFICKMLSEREINCNQGAM